MNLAEFEIRRTRHGAVEVVRHLCGTVEVVTLARRYSRQLESDRLTASLARHLYGVAIRYPDELVEWREVLPANLH